MKFPVLVAAKLEDWYGPICSRTDQTSADKDIESPDTSVSSLTDQTGRQRTDFFENPDGIQTADGIETDKFRTNRNRTKNTDTIRTVDRHRAGFFG